jgi:DNA-directed RNA polymerase subunit M/transcription elongation factor TFIIS
MVNIKDSETFRNNIRQELNKILNNDKNSTNLEKGIFNYTLKEANQRKVMKKWDNEKFVCIYVDKLRSVYMNLTKPNIIEQINNNSIQIHTIAFMSHQELDPEKWNELIKLKSVRDKNKYEVNIEAATDTFKCRGCGESKCTYYLQQTRSADEPTTIFVTCLSCGKRWKTC